MPHEGPILRCQLHLLLWGVHRGQQPLWRLLQVGASSLVSISCMDGLRHVGVLGTQKTFSQYLADVPIVNFRDLIHNPQKLIPTAKAGPDSPISGSHAERPQAPCVAASSSP